MENGNQLSARLREVFLDGRWIANTNYQDAVAGLTWEQATQKIGSLNTIAALTFHINYYLEGILNVFEGGGLEIHDKYSFDAPEITSGDEWKDRVDTFVENAGKFAEHVAGMSDDILEGPFVDANYGSYRRNIEGVIEHSYYHLGQISLIKKMVLESA